MVFSIIIFLTTLLKLHQTIKYFIPFLKSIALNKHDRYVEQLCQNLSPQYDQVLSHVLLFSSKNRRVAEIDVLGIKGNSCDAYEVKCSYRPTKARKQLRRIRKVLSPCQNEAGGPPVIDWRHVRFAHRQPILSTREMWKLPHFCAEGSALLAQEFHRRSVFSTGYTESLRSWVCSCKQPVEFRVFKEIQNTYFYCGDAGILEKV